MTRYLTQYRFFILAKAGLCVAYLWICWDFFRINHALDGSLQDLLPKLSGETIIANDTLNTPLRATLEFLSQPAAIWLYLFLAPIAVALFVWGKFRWLQLGVGFWLWLSLIGLTARASILMSTADFWLNWSFILYAAAALITPKGRWENSQPPLTRELWQKNPTLASEYALLLVVLQFTVYFYAGVNKLLDGWVPWTTGTALQNLSYDLSMRDYALGTPVPFALSFVLCYFTLFQRLIVPFGFFVMRYRGWAVLILGSMHAGYEALMEVAIFPLVGLSGLLMIIPPRELAHPLFSRPSLKPGHRLTHYLKSLPRPRYLIPQRLLLIVALAALLIEPIVNINLTPELPYWQIKTGSLLHWTMFSDGGASSRIRLHVHVRMHDPQTGAFRIVDISDLPLRYLPGTWRTRFYQQTLLFKAMAAKNATGEQLSQPPYLADYLRIAVALYNQDVPNHPRIEKVSLSLDPYHPVSNSPGTVQR